MFDLQQKEKEKQKLKLKIIKFNFYHFHCHCASSSTSKFVYKPELTPPWHLPYMDISVTQQNNRLNYRVDNVIWRHVCFNIMNTDDSQVTWLTSFSEPILCYLYSGWLPRAQNLVYIADEICRFEAPKSSSDQMSNDLWSHSIHFPTTAVRTRCSIRE